MKRLIKIIAIITGIFAVLNIVFRISFTLETVDTILLIAFGLSVTTYLVLLFPRIWMRITSVSVLTVMIVISWWAWQIVGYESRIDRTWQQGEYNIQLEHRLHIAGPGCFWFLMNRELLGGIIEKSIETRQYQAALPDPPEIFKFVTSKIQLE